MSPHDYRDLMREVRERHAPRSDEVDQLLERVGAATASRREPAPRHAPALPFLRWGLLWKGLVLAAVAVVLWALADRIPRVFSGPVQVPLAADARARLALTPYIGLAYEGRGRVTGTADDVLIVWAQGLLEVDVSPGRGLSVLVETPDALTHVVGTRFTVDRSHHATTVRVAEGTVSVDCAAPWSPSARVRAGGSHRCLPDTVAELHLRAVSLRGAGADPEEVLEAVDLGLAQDPEGPLRHELLAARVGPLVDLGRRADALETLEAYLAEGPAPRAERFRRLALELAVELGRCERAASHLAALPSAIAEERAAVEQCGGGAPGGR